MKRPLIPVLLLATVSIIGIAGMLVAEGVWDWTFLAMAAAPIVLGAAMLCYRRD